MKSALIKDGLTITDDPYRIAYEDSDVFADLRVSKTTPSKFHKVLVIEIKEFTSVSPMNRLEQALGQFQVYRSYLHQVAPDEKLYLAVGRASYEKQFSRKSFQRIVEDYKLSLVVVDIPLEEIFQWIN